MNQFISGIVNRHHLVARYAILIVAVIAIAFSFPKSGVFKYEFEVGKPWRFENLFSPFSFAVLKTSDEYEQQIKEAKSSITPYYRVDESVMTQSRNIYMKGISNYLEAPPADSLRVAHHGLRLLNSLYESGIIRLDEKHINLPPSQIINVVKSGNIVSPRSLSSFYTFKSAYSFIRDTLSRLTPKYRNPLITAMEEAIAYNIIFDDSLTERMERDRVENISSTKGMIQEGEMIISKGSIVTEEKYQILKSFRAEFETRVIGIEKGRIIYLGNLLLVALVLGSLMLYFSVFSPDILESNSKLLLILFLITMMVFLVGILSKSELPILYALPVCIIPVVIKNFFDTGTAIYAHITFLILSGFIVPDGVEFFFLQTIAGMVVIFSSVKAQYWNEFFTANLYVLIAYLICYFSISLVQEGDIGKIDYTQFGWLTINSLFLFLAYPLIPVFEKSFGLVSDITLLEYGDISKPLLKELSVKAPGTFQHSLHVASLAETAAIEIKANALLVKVGSLYHDIGKMYNAAYFAENQTGEVNPHEELSSEKSAQIIISHVKKGIELAKKNNIPDIIIDFIRTHHGTTKTEYFYTSWINNHPDEDVEDKIFTYPGPIPNSKETAIVMLADSCEAASRSLKNPTDKDIDKLVEKMINHKIEQQQLVNSDITLKEISSIKKIFKKMLGSMYHVRVAYPELKKRG